MLANRKYQNISLLSVSVMNIRIMFFNISSVVISIIILFLPCCTRHKTHPSGISSIADSIHSMVLDNFSTVEKGAFYRSGQLSAGRLSAYIKRYGIKTVINLRGNHPEKKWWQKEFEVTQKNNVLLFDIPMKASYLTSKKNIRTLLNIFDTASRPMLVHCRVGVDRTGEAAALWVLDQQHKSNKTALKQLTIWHRHNRLAHPAKTFLIKIWRGRQWLENEYDPRKYPKFKEDRD